MFVPEQKGLVLLQIVQNGFDLSNGQLHALRDGLRRHRLPHAREFSNHVVANLMVFRRHETKIVAQVSRLSGHLPTPE
jgi:hypothetical protein